MQLEELVVDMRWLPTCENVSPEAGQWALLEDITKHSSEDCDREHLSLCMRDLQSVFTSCKSVKSSYQSNLIYSKLDQVKVCLMLKDFQISSILGMLSQSSSKTGLLHQYYPS
jgi:hypothetical protein